MKRVGRLCTLALLAVIDASTALRAVSPDIVISQVYGGGGNTGATFTNDFIELYNRGSVPVVVTGWTVQYAAAAGSTWQTTTLSGTIQPGNYYLVQEAAGAGGTTALPTPDAIGTISMAAGAAKVALVRNSTALTGACPGGVEIADFVGYGGANCSETTPTAALTSATAALRLQGGATDTDNNAADFLIGGPAPRNSGAPAAAALTGVGSAIPTTIDAGGSSLLTVKVSPGTNPSSTGITVSADLTAINGLATQPLNDASTDGDVTAGDNVFSFLATPTVTSGSFSLPVSIADAQGRSASTTIALAMTAPPANVVISQVYGGGGNSGATFTNDFIELFNRESFDVSVAGWTVQYTSSAGTSWASTTLTGTIPAGGYYLVQEAAGSGGTVPLPTPDATGNLAMAATSGKVALVSGPGPLTGACPLSGALDFVGYGGANCFEGTGAAPALSNTTAAIRLDGGLLDTNDNSADFSAGSPEPKGALGVPPRGTGAASPASLANGATTLLTIKVTQGAFPPSPVTSVTVDLTPLGGGSQPFFDDGTHGDVQAGDGIYSDQVVVSGTPGFKVLAGTVGDARGRSGAASIRLAIETTTTTPISLIQGNGSTSPLVDQFVTTTGIVTALRSSGFYVQTPDGLDDLDPATSEGLFVFTSGATMRPSVGDAVRVTGVVSEFAPAPPSPPGTELGGGPVFAVIDSGQPLPVPVVLQPADTSPAGSLEQLERYEGMRVQADLSIIAPTDGSVFESAATASSNGVFYAVINGLARPVREPGVDPASATPPGLPCCVPRFDGNPERLRVDSNAQPGSTLLNVAAGQRIFGMTGVLDFAFGSYTILPDPGAGTVVGAQEATPVPVASASEFTVASANLERFFDEQDDPDHDDAVLTADAVNLRLQKASLTVRYVLRSPDVLGVVEVENLSILQRLAARINADAVAEGDSDPMYVAYLEEGNDIGGIDSGFLVKSARVDVISVEQVGKDTTYTTPDGMTALLNDRPPLVLKAAVNGPVATPFPITVIVNHLRSLSGIDGTDGARIRAKRRAQAEFLASLIDAHQAAERVISVGDYNAFPFNDGLVDVVGTVKGQPTPETQVALASPDLVEPDLTNLGDVLGAAQQYSFVFDGNAQALDHIIVNSLALKRVTRAAYARSNADFPESLRGDATRPERLSDHDAAIAYFAFPDAPAVTLVGGGQIDVEAYTGFTDPGAMAHDDEGPLPVTTSGSVDVNTPGDYTLTYSATNGYLTTTITRFVRVQDTIAPHITDFRVTPTLLTPINHQLVDVAALYGVTDASGAVTCALSVSSNEVKNGPGDGNTALDWVIIDAQHVQLRAERSGRGNGRTYVVGVACADGAGNISHEAARVLVPK
jgi:predicted extracellular nuclease